MFVYAHRVCDFDVDKERDIKRVFLSININIYLLQYCKTHTRTRNTTKRNIIFPLVHEPQKLNHIRKFNAKGNKVITLTIKDINYLTKPHGNRKSLCCLSS